MLPPALRRALRPLDFRPDRYRGPLAETAHRLAAAAERREISADGLLDAFQSALDETDVAAEFAPWADAGPLGDHVDRWLCRRRARGLARGRPGLAMRLVLIYLGAGCSEPPHHHNQLASLQCVVRGRVLCRQYDRVARRGDDVLTIRPVSQKTLTVGETFRTTDHETNVHWFGAEDEPAVLLDFFVEGRGLYEAPFEPDPTRPLGRRYLDPTGAPGADTLIAAKELSPEEAYRRFAAKRLSAFDWPAFS
jgi:hypothetical protein